MDVLIGRGQRDIGKFPREQLPALARKGEIRPTDIYWHEGMERWKPLSELLNPSAWEAESKDSVVDPFRTPAGSSDEPARTASEVDPASTPGAAPLRPRRDWRIVAAICAGGFIALLVLAKLLITPDTEPLSPVQTTRSLSGSPTPAVDALAVREKALADLRQRLERLPEQPAPPLNTFYYDFTIEMNETFQARTPWNVVIRGRENVLKPDSEETLSKTEFVLTAEYADGEWVYKAYVGTTLNMQDQTSITLRHDATRLAPPALVGILGLKTADFSRSLPP